MVCHSNIFAECHVACEIPKILTKYAFVVKSDSDSNVKINTVCLFDLETKIHVVDSFPNLTGTKYRRGRENHDS